MVNFLLGSVYKINANYEIDFYDEKDLKLLKTCLHINGYATSA